MTKSIAQQLIETWTNPTADQKTEIKQQLASGVWTLEFTKVDGTPSIMDVTLDPAIVPQTPIKEGKTPREEPEHLIQVYSTDRDGWRSFAFKNVKSIYRSNRSPYQTRIDSILCNQLGIGPSDITPESRLFEDLGCDSLDFVELIMAIEDEFNLEVMDEEANEVRSVRDCYDLVARRKLK